MSIRIFVLGVVGVAATLWGQRGAKKFSWQDYCFKNTASPVCRDRDYAGKPPPKEPPPTRSVYTNPFPSTPFPRVPANGTPALIEVGGMDWRFADPFAD